MHVLVTNDDGIDAPGIAALIAVVAEFAQVTVVATHQCFSGCGHQVTNDGPVRVQQVADRRFKVFGTPADCTRLGLTEIAPDVDWVLSGINAGANLGVDLVMSGTVAAVREAVWLGKPGIAVSQYTRRERPRDWTRTRILAARVLRELMESKPPRGEFWNVNLPDCDTEASRIPIRETFPEPKHLLVQYEFKPDEGYQYRGDYRQRPRTDGSDVDVCFGGSISVSRVST